MSYFFLKNYVLSFFYKNKNLKDLTDCKNLKALTDCVLGFPLLHSNYSHLICICVTRLGATWVNCKGSTRNLSATLLHSCRNFNTTCVFRTPHNASMPCTAWLSTESPHSSCQSPQTNSMLRLTQCTAVARQASQLLEDGNSTREAGGGLKSGMPLCQMPFACNQPHTSLCVVPISVERASTEHHMSIWYTVKVVLMSVRCEQ